MNPEIRAPGIFVVAMRRGLALGFGLAIVESLRNIPAHFTIQIQFPMKEILISLVFDLTLGAVIGLVATPLLNLRRGRLWHSAAMLLMISTLTLSLQPTLGANIIIESAAAIAVVICYVSGLWMGRRATSATVGLVLGVAVIAVANGIPWWVAPPFAAGSEDRASAPADAPNILLVMMDTFRADHLDVYGFGRETFPWLESFAREGAIFKRALSAAPWTLPSHASMFTGLYPSTHGAHNERRYLDYSWHTLPEILQEHGWTTVAFSANPVVSRPTGLLQGFASADPLWMGLAAPMYFLGYRVALKVGLLDQDHGGRNVTDAWLAWLNSWKGERPFFAFLNYIEPHFPYHQLPADHLTHFTAENVPKRELIQASKRVQNGEMVGAMASETDRQIVKDLYDGGIRYEGELVAEVVEALRARRVLDRTIVILVSDHGELLGEHDMFGHFKSLSEALLAVPLVFRYPPRVPQGLVIDTPVTTAALLPTILDLAMLPPVKNIQTSSFAPLFSEDVEAARSPLLAEQYQCWAPMDRIRFKPRHAFDRLGVRYRALEENGWKLVVDSEGSRWLFRPIEDPAELNNLAEQNPEITERMEAALSALVDAYGMPALDSPLMDSSQPVEMSPEMRDALEALGYVDE